MELNNEEETYYTFGFLKPDGMEHVEEIIKMIQNKGLRFLYWDYVTLTGELIDEHYPHVKKANPDDYKKLYNHMKDKLALVYVLYDPSGNAIKNYREVLGATKSWEAASDTIRGRFGDKKRVYKNTAHGSGNKKEAQEEIIRFCAKDLFELFDSLYWLRNYESALFCSAPYADHVKEYADKQTLNTILKEHYSYTKNQVIKCNSTLPKTRI